jgi:hypothetical protein
MRYHETLVACLVSKLVLDILPAAAASLAGGFLFTHCGLGRVTEPAAQAAPAPAEMMQLLRDEHGLIVTFQNAQLARERSELAAEDAARRGSGEAIAAADTSGRMPGAGAAAKPAVTRAKIAVAAAAPAAEPLVIAQAQRVESAGAASPVPQMLIAKTMGITDHVVSVTHRVVAAIGGIPSWFRLIGGRGGAETMPRPSADMVSAS